MDDLRTQVAKLIDISGWFNSNKDNTFHVLNNFPNQHLRYQETLKSKADDIILLVKSNITVGDI